MIQFYRSHSGSILTQVSGQNAYARSNLQNTAILIDAGNADDFFRYPAADKEILTKTLGKVEIIPSQQFPQGFHIGKIHVNLRVFE